MSSVTQQTDLLRKTRDLDHLAMLFQRADPGLIHSVRMAEIYRLGQFPYIAPDNLMVKELCGQMKRLPLRPLMMNLIQECLDSLIEPCDVHHDAMPLPTEPAHKVSDLFTHLNVERWVVKLRPTPSVTPSSIIEQTTTISSHVDIDSQQLVQVMAAANDAQNVHQSVIVKNTKEAISQLMGDYHKYEKNETLISKWTLLFRFYQYPSLWKHLAGIKLVLLSLSNNVWSYDCSERQLLTAVVWKINEQKTAVMRHALMHSLGLALASAVEMYMVVCHTGKMSRIISVVQYLELDNAPIAKLNSLTPALRTEVMTMASKIRDSWMQTQSVEMQVQYMSGDADSTAKLRQHFLNQFRETYESLLEPHVVRQIEEESMDYF